MDPILILVLLWLLRSPVFLALWMMAKKTAEKTNSELELKNDELAKLKNYQPRYNRRCRVGKNFALGA